MRTRWRRCGRRPELDEDVLPWRATVFSLITSAGRSPGSPPGGDQPQHLELPRRQSVARSERRAGERIDAGESGAAPSSRRRTGRIQLQRRRVLVAELTARRPTSTRAARPRTGPPDPATAVHAWRTDQSGAGVAVRQLDRAPCVGGDRVHQALPSSPRSPPARGRRRAPSGRRREQISTRRAGAAPGIVAASPIRPIAAAAARLSLGQPQEREPRLRLMPRRLASRYASSAAANSPRRRCTSACW